MKNRLPADVINYTPIGTKYQEAASHPLKGRPLYGILCHVMALKAKTEFPSGEPARSQRISIIEGSFASVHIAVSLSSLVTAYALMLGANDFHLGLLSAVGAAGTLGAVAGSWGVSLAGSRKILVVAAAVAGRALWSLLCLLPFLPVLPGWRLPAFFLVILLSNLLINAANNGWLSWMTDLVPLEKRGRYFGKRNTILGAVSMAVTFASGKAFDWFKAGGRQETGFALIFGLAVLCALVSGVILAGQWEPQPSVVRSMPVHRMFRSAFHDRRFRPLLMFFILWSLATSVAGPFFGAHMIKNLGMPLGVIALYSIIAGSVNLLAQPLWGRVIDRLGNKPVLIFTMLGIFFLPLFWLFSGPDFYLPIWIDAFLTGIFWPGFGLATFNLLLITAPEDDRQPYLAVQNVATGLSVFLASLAGGALAKWLDGVHLRFLGQELINFHLLFALSSLLRLAILPLALRLPEERSGSVGALLDLLGNKASQALSESLRSGVMVVKRLGRK